VLIQHSKYVNTKYLSGAWLGGDSRVDTKKMRLKRDWTTCSNFVSHSRLNTQYNQSDLYNHSMSTRVSHFDNEKDINTSSKKL
jgi:hypothetical protein